MDQTRFDQFVQQLGTTRSRRSALGAGLAALLAVATCPGVAPVVAKKRKPKQCGPCEVRQGERKCKPAPDNKRCKGDGRCLRGKCNQPPGCESALSPCLVSSECCSGVCDTLGGICFFSQVGQPCNVDADCDFEGTCFGYRCRA